MDLLTLSIQDGTGIWKELSEGRPVPIYMVNSTQLTEAIASINTTEQLLTLAKLVEQTNTNLLGIHRRLKYILLALAVLIAVVILKGVIGWL